MDFRYHDNPVTGQPHIYDHGVTEAEVEQVFRNSGEDLPGRGDSRMRLGQTDAGRYLQVIYVPDDPQSAFVVTAYELRGKAKQAYRRRRRRRGR